jgi:hypothetical protein
VLSRANSRRTITLKQSKYGEFVTKRIWIICGWLIIDIVCSQAEGNAPLQGWLNTSVSQRFDYSLVAKVEAEAWGSAGNPGLARYEFTPQLLWHYSPRYDFTVGYQHSETFRQNEAGLEGDTAVIAAQINVPFAKDDWLFTSRQRFQFGSGDPAYANIFRHQVTLQYLGLLPDRIKPFLADEYFVSFLAGDISENRASIGVNYQVNRVTSIDLYFMADHTWSPGQIAFTPVMGLNLNLHF